MNQSNKEYIRLLIDSGVHTLLKETPNNFLNFSEKLAKNNISLDSYKLNEIKNINQLISCLSNYECVLKKNANKLVVFDGDISSKLMIIGDFFLHEN